MASAGRRLLVAGRDREREEGLEEYKLMEEEVGMDEDTEERALCRVCFEPEDSRDFRDLPGDGDSADGRLLAPCACRGTQLLVHARCLRAWQAAAPTEEAATRCSTCRAPFSVVLARPEPRASPPPVSPLQRQTVVAYVLLVSALRSAWRATAVLSIGAAAVAASYDLAPAAVASVYGAALLGCLGFYAWLGDRRFALAVADPPAQGLGLELRLLPRGGEMQPGVLRPGRLIVATERADVIYADGRFTRCAVLLTEGAVHRGVSGLVLGKQIANTMDPEPPRSLFGGPVGTLQARTLVHTLSRLPGKEIVAPGEGAPPVRMLSWNAANLRVDVGEWLQRAQEAEGVDANGDACRCHLFCGIASWFPGQLEAEMRFGAWRLADTATAEDVFAEDAGELWDRLHADGRVEAQVFEG